MSSRRDTRFSHCGSTTVSALNH